MKGQAVHDIAGTLENPAPSRVYKGQLMGQFKLHITIQLVKRSLRQGLTVNRRDSLARWSGRLQGVFCTSINSGIFLSIYLGLLRV